MKTLFQILLDLPDKHTIGALEFELEWEILGRALIHWQQFYIGETWREHTQNLLGADDLLPILVELFKDYQKFLDKVREKLDKNLPLRDMGEIGYVFTNLHSIASVLTDPDFNADVLPDNLQDIFAAIKHKVKTQPFDSSDLENRPMELIKLCRAYKKCIRVQIELVMKAQYPEIYAAYLTAHSNLELFEELLQSKEELLIQKYRAIYNIYLTLIRPSPTGKRIECLKEQLKQVPLAQKNVITNFLSFINPTTLSMIEERFHHSLNEYFNGHRLIKNNI